MASTQQALITDTVAAIRRALKRKACDSDSDSEINQNTNRGNKLKRRARFVQRGHLDSGANPTAYRQRAEHAGYQRAIISRNPPLVDEEGYDVDSDDSEEQVQEARAKVKAENPYADFSLEHLLAPLTSVTDLPTHPTLSKPYNSKALTELANQACDLMHRENAALWKTKPLLTRLCGDHTWAPCGIMIEDRDHELYSDTAGFYPRKPLSHTEDCVPSKPDRDDPGSSTSADLNPEPGAQATYGGTNVSFVVAVHLQDSEDLAHGKDTGADKKNERAISDQAGNEPDEVAQQSVNGDRKAGHASRGLPPIDRLAIPERDASSAPKLRIHATDRVLGHHVELAQAPPEARDVEYLLGKLAIPTREDGENGGIFTTPGYSDEPFIHPLFLLPRSAHPDRDLAVPAHEAEDIRRMLQLYVQKQEEICRGTRKLCEGLLKADRLRKQVLKWAKAEAHCGPDRDMSDGEDWYDKEEWGLDEDLKKGQDEEEEDPVQTQKKTRNRR